MKKEETATKRPELLAPAGDFEKMKIALAFGADAVYFGLPDFSLRARINKFGKKEIREGANLCRKLKKKFYVTINIYAHNKHIEKLPKHLEFVNEIKPDAIILSDPGVLLLVKKHCPNIAIHLSTQANATNAEAVKFWQSQGVERIILARELSLSEIKEIKKQAPKMELEVFVHGAMCMAYSGRCILSRWMTGRSANLGDCAQSCRWKYRKVQNAKCKMQNNGNHNPPVSPLILRGEEVGRETVVDDKGRFEVDLEEDENGSYFFNSFDICLIEHLDKLKSAGIDSFKIEGRGKSVYYVAVVTRAYRKVIDSASMLSRCEITQEEMNNIVTDQKKELEKLSHRGYWTGFVLGQEPPHLTDQAQINTIWKFVGISNENKNSNKRIIFVHNKLSTGDKIEIITPKETIKSKIVSIKHENETISSSHGGQEKEFEVEFDKKIAGIFLIRKNEAQMLK